MSERKTIAKLGSNPMKQDEMDFLRAVAASVPDDSYLSNLFNGDFCKWVEAQIRQDVSCDLWGAFAHALERALAEGGRAMEQEKVANATIASLKVEAIAAQDRVEAYLEKLARTEEKAQLLKDRWHEALEETKAVQSDAYQAGTEIAQLNGEIVVLKAKLYDAIIVGKSASKHQHRTGANHEIRRASQEVCSQSAALQSDETWSGTIQAEWRAD